MASSPSCEKGGWPMSCDSAMALISALLAAPRWSASAISVPVSATVRLWLRRFWKAGDFEGAYVKTFHAEYKRQLSLETFVKYRQGIAQTAGTIDSYQMVHYDADTERDSVTLNYAVKYSNMPEAGTEIVKLRREGTEWRISSVEPKIPKKALPAPDITMPGVTPAPHNQNSNAPK